MQGEIAAFRIPRECCREHRPQCQHQDEILLPAKVLVNGAVKKETPDREVGGWPGIYSGETPAASGRSLEKGSPKAAGKLGSVPARRPCGVRLRRNFFGTEPVDRARAGPKN